MMLKIFGVCLFLASTLEIAVQASAQNASSYVLSDAITGHVLDSYRAEQKRAVASLTKIATAKVVLDWAARSGTDLSQQVTIPVQVFAISGSINPVGLQPNDLVSYRDLLYSTMLESDNIAATTLAYYVGAGLRAQGGPELQELGAVEAFVSQMNALARHIGMVRTLFVNPHGLEPVSGLQPYSTALDLSKLATYAMNDAAFRFYVSQKERRISLNRVGQSLQYILHNTNELLGKNGIDGIKTGRTAKAGDCIIISAQRDPEVTQQGNTTYVTRRRVNIVVLGAADRFTAADQLLERAWALYDQWAAVGRPPAVH